MGASGAMGAQVASVPQVLPVAPWRVLVVDRDEECRRLLGRMLTTEQSTVLAIPDTLDALDVIREEHIDVVFLDLTAPNQDGLELLQALRAAQSQVPVVVTMAQATVEDSVNAMKLGATDFLSKPFSAPGALAERVQRWALPSVSAGSPVLAQEGLARLGIIGESPAMLRVASLVQSVAKWSATVLLTGESGTGKEIIARALHAASPRCDKPFVAINCSAVPETLLESELFGHVKGAFTGAASQRDGLFHAADGGTLFLDEIGDMPLALQAKLLRALQEGEIRRIGSSTSSHVDVRLIAATNVDLDKARLAGRFREDLYYRLDVVSIALPPLRDRREDIPRLATHFLRKHAEAKGKTVHGFSNHALDVLLADDWPGNVRQLENVIERAVLLSQGPRIDVGDLSGLKEPSSDSHSRIASRFVSMPLAAARKSAMESFDRRYLEMRLHHAKGNVSEAARLADMDRANFRRLLKRYGLEPKLYGRGGESE
jgi:two-component system response regulator HydG